MVPCCSKAWGPLESTITSSAGLPQLVVESPYLEGSIPRLRFLFQFSVKHLTILGSFRYFENYIQQCFEYCFYFALSLIFMHVCVGWDGRGKGTCHIKKLFSFENAT